MREPIGKTMYMTVAAGSQSDLALRLRIVVLCTLLVWGGFLCEAKSATDPGLADPHPSLPRTQSAESPSYRVSIVSHHGMPRDIVAQGHRWNFSPSSLWTHRGWQYAAYWDDARQVSVARRKLPAGPWEVASLFGYQRRESGDRGKGGAISRGFGDGHEKVALGISADGFIHLSFDHHLSTLRYRVSRKPVAEDPAVHEWRADLFGPVQDHLGGPRLESVTYPSFYADGSELVLYLRLGGGSGSANSHFFTYSAGRWVVDSEAASEVINKRWSGGDGTVNAYTHELVFHNGRRHLTWCWRDTPDARTCHDLCYAYSDDRGKTWLNNEGQVIGIAGIRPITADSPGVVVWGNPPGTSYRNGGSMIVDRRGGVHVLMRGENARPVYFGRDPGTGRWTPGPADVLGTWVVGEGDDLYVVSENGLHRMSATQAWKVTNQRQGHRELSVDAKIGTDRMRPGFDGWVSVIGQHGKTVRVVDYRLGAFP